MVRPGGAALDGLDRLDGATCSAPGTVTAAPLAARARHAAYRPRRDAGFLVTWPVRIVVVLALAALALFEVASLLFARFSASDMAVKATEEARFVYRNMGDLQRAQAAASEKAADGGAVLDTLTIDDQAQTATVTLHKRANTLVIERFDVFRKYVTATSTETAPLPR
jgi:hypothetical protein